MLHALLVGRIGEAYAAALEISQVEFSTCCVPPFVAKPSSSEVYLTYRNM